MEKLRQLLTETTLEKDDANERFAKLSVFGIEQLPFQRVPLQKNTYSECISGTRITQIAKKLIVYLVYLSQLSFIFSSVSSLVTTSIVFVSTTGASFGFSKSIFI